MPTKMRLQVVKKPWGRDDLAPPFADPVMAQQPRVGEFWYQSDAPGADDPLLIKYLFTSEKLSVQVHPDDAAGHARGHKSGKAECWYIVDAAPDAVLGLGLKEPISAEELREASLSDAVEHMIDWKPTKAGDIWYVEPGTIHAIGPGLTLIEVQQNIDLTYRLYDYGRPRELHLDDGIAVSKRAPYAMANHAHYDGETPFIRQWPHFGMALCSDTGQLAEIMQATDRDSYWIPVSGDCQLDDTALVPGNVYHVAAGASGETANMAAGATLLIGWPNRQK